MHNKAEEEVPLHSSDDGAEYSDNREDVESLDFSHHRPTKSTAGCCKFFGWAFAWVGTVFFSALIGAWISLETVNLDQNCAARTTQWSRAGVISYKDGLASGLDPSFVQRNEKHGGGFLVNVEGMHHLHCLNLVRKSLWFNYDYYKGMKMHAFQNEEDILRLHVTHCLDTVRQVLMCNVDTSVLGQVWVASDNPEDPIAFPDFNTRHVCKNYEAVKDWAEKLQAPPVDEVPDDFLAQPKPEDIIPQTP
ncbi:hypothetical protein G7046_g791 [Stylonectria norvegica]|nr:hypothetical protein G7046_g791 [Stylonectria norvegica]